MNRNAPALEVGSGRGFDFEDFVAAEFLLGMLTGDCLFGATVGEASRVRWQTGDLGWRLDDLLVEMVSESGTTQVAVSCRSGREVTGRGFKSDFGSAAWHHWQNPGNPAFDKSRDLFCLATGELADSVQANWNQLLSASLRADVDRAVGRLNKPCRAILHSLHCPGTAGDVIDDETWKVTSHIRLLKRDFFHSPSQSLVFLISSAQRAVASGAATDAQALWDRLLVIAKRSRSHGADFRRPQLLDELRGSVALIEHPNHAPDLALLDRCSLEFANEVHAGIGPDGIVLERPELKAQLLEALKSGPIVAVRGESGTGKSALVRDTALESGKRMVWFAADSLRHANTADFEHALGLRHRLDCLLENAITPCIVVFDAVERCCPVGRSLVRKLVSQLTKARSARIVIVLTCQTETWGDLGSEFLDPTVSPDSVKTIEVKVLTTDEVAQVVKQVPNLQHPTIQSALGRLARNIKFLDWIVHAGARHGAEGLESCVGLTPLIDWLWRRWIGSDSDRHARGAVLQRVALNEAKGLTSGAPLAEFASDELQRVEAMEREGLLRVRDERIRFSHDLLGDCARLRLLIGNDPTASETKRQDYSAPQWHRAVRLYGQWLLESHADGLSRWRSAMQRCNAASQGARILRDLMLEAILLSAADDSLWEHAWPELIANNGEHLNRILHRARLVATFADPRIRRRVEDREVAERLSIICRIPRIEYWSIMLRVLRNRTDDVVRVARTEAARVCKLWLETMPWRLNETVEFPLRREAAELAVAIAKEVQGLLAEDEHLADQEEHPELEALLAAAPDLPDEVADVALQLANRRDPPPHVVARSDEHQRHQEEARRQWESDNPQSHIPQGPTIHDLFEFGDLLPPWADGPRSRVPDEFRNVVLSQNAILPLLKCRPQAAVELVLAVCIDAPKPENSAGYYDSLAIEDVGLENWHDGHPPMFFQGPFLNMLRSDATRGIDVVIRLVNFATERHCERERRIQRRQSEETPSPLSVEFLLPTGDVCVWQGDGRTYGWHREIFIDSTILVSALMALERWLYELCDENLANVKPYLALLVQESHSVALAGLLVDVGKRHPILFEDVLQLLSAWQLYEWDRRLVMEGDVWRIGMVSWVGYGEEAWSRAKDWHQMPHRKQYLLEVAVKLFLTHEGTQQFYALVREHWERLRASGQPDDRLRLLIERFNLANYRAQRVDEDTVHIGLSWPEPMREANESAVSRADMMMRILTFPTRCRNALTTETPIPASDLEAFCGEVRAMASYVASDEEDFERSRADAVTGGIAVLVILHAHWLKANAELSEWCCHQLEGVLESPPCRLPGDIPESTTDTHWEGFIAEILVCDVADAPDDETSRLLFVQLATSPLFTTTALMFRRAFLMRGQLGTEFERFVNLVIFLAGLWRVISACRNWGIESPYPEKAWRRLCRGFVSKRLPSFPLDWSVVAQCATTRIVRVQRARFPQAQRPIHFHQHDDERHVARNDPGFDIEFLRYVFGRIPTFDRSWSQTQRQQYGRIVHDLLSVSLRMLPTLEEGQKVDGTPFPFDRWVFELTAKTIARLAGNGEARELWRPILALGPKFHYWVDTFLSDWMIHGFQAAESPEEFVSCWREMLTFALSEVDWNDGWRVDELAVEICGLNYGRTSIGDNVAFAPLLEQMVPLFAQAAAKWFRRVEVAQKFARFLGRPAARSLIPDGLQWLWTSVSAFDESAWGRDDNVERDLMSGLRSGWQHCSEIISQDDAVRDAFLGILNALTSRQNHAAIALRDQVLSSLSVQ